MNTKICRLTIIIPAFNSSKTIGLALFSIFNSLPVDFEEMLEVIVVDDGGSDAITLESECTKYKKVKLLKHHKNLGMCAARNTGIRESSGEYVTLLDSDDEFLQSWWRTFEEILIEWPKNVNVCYTQCVNDAGLITCADPKYNGFLTVKDIIDERYSGEYNPIFRGDYIRRSGYDDLGTRKSCGLLSYLRMARDAPFWIADKVMRRYHDAAEQSVTRGWTRPDKAAETYTCFSSVLAEHGDFIRSVDPEKHLQLRQKILIYRMLSCQGRDFAEWWRTRSWNTPWFATLALLLLGPANSAKLLGFAKRISLLRRYG
jgi:glycosyltransferase involved in cell wall biosynthesis